MASSSGRSGPGVRVVDPDRRDRIVDACLEVIAESGVAGTSARRIAAAAGVPLGSITYYFDGMDAIIHAALERFSHEVSDGFVARLGAAADREGFVQALVDTIEHQVFGSVRELVLTHELYTLAAREPRYRTLTNAWMRRSRAALAAHVDDDTARMLDALIEGLTIHRALDTEPAPAGLAERAVRALMAAG